MLLLCCCFQLNAQQVSQKILRSKWVKIMANDSSYNFLEAQKEFQGFYTAFLKEERKEQLKKQRNKSSAEEVHLESQLELLVADYLRWSVMIKPFVNADGTVMPLKERLTIINNSKRN